MKRNLLSLSLAGLLLAACGSGVYEKTEQGIIVHVRQADSVATAPRLVRLQVVGENIIHVSATAEKKFADPQSLIVVDQEGKTPYEVTEQGDTITVSTSSVKANVLASTGEVWFTDTEGNLIVHEQNGGGKTFTPYQCTQTHADGKD